MEKRSPALQVLTCDLILENILSCLPLEDLKSLTVVARGIKEAVRKTKHFSNRVQLQVTEEAIEQGLIVEGVFSPKHVFLELFNCLPLERGLIRELVEGAESLQLCFQRPPVAFDEEINHYMSLVLTTAKNLRSLELSSGLLYKVSPQLFSKLEIQETLSRLHSLKITAGQPQVYPEGLHEVFEQSFAKIGTLPLNLRTFHMGKVSYYFDGMMRKEFVSFIPLILEKSKETLEELELLDARIWMWDELNDIICPNLKRLSISALWIGNSFLTVESFLRNQLPLEEIDIFLFVFPRQIVELILGSSSKLKRLSLKTKEFVGGARTIDWKKLEGMAELKEFSLVVTHEEFQTVNNPPWRERGGSILRSLPRTVEKVTLQGFRYFWRRGGNPGRKSVGLALTGCSNLTELNLDRCYGAVTDVGLQSLIRLCPKLTKLRFSHSDHVTNYGVTGVQSGNGVKAGLSLDDLKSLTHLVIMYCPDISPEVLVDALRFKCLRSLTYVRMDPVPKEVLVRAALRNPFLERLRMNTTRIADAHTAPVDLKALKEEVFKANPRIRCLIMKEPCWFDGDMDI